MNISDVRGVIFDVDDTLLNNFPPEFPLGLHEQSRLEAAHVVGKRHEIKGLQGFTLERAHQAFLDAPVHSIYGAIWQMLTMVDEVTGDLDYDHPLLKEMIEVKEKVHEQTLRSYGREVPGAIRFVEMLAKKHGLKDRMAIASSSPIRDIVIFFDMVNLHRFFPTELIVSHEKFKNSKPHPEPFELAFASLGLPDKTGVIAFEDDPRGVQSAKAAGLFVFAITTRIRREQFEVMDTPPDLVADSYADFRRLLGM